jgi:hypothetical protein
MECAIIDIRANSGLYEIVHSVHLLLIGDEMFDGRDDSDALNPFDG